MPLRSVPVRSRQARDPSTSCPCAILPKAPLLSCPILDFANGGVKPAAEPDGANQARSNRPPDARCVRADARPGADDGRPSAFEKTTPGKVEFLGSTHVLWYDNT